MPIRRLTRLAQTSVIMLVGNKHLRAVPTEEAKSFAGASRLSPLRRLIHILTVTAENGLSFIDAAVMAYLSCQAGRPCVIEQKPNTPVSQICALSVFPSTLIERVANSTPIVDFVSRLRLNSLRVNCESTCHKRSIESPNKLWVSQIYNVHHTTEQV